MFRPGLWCSVPPMRFGTSNVSVGAAATVNLNGLNAFVGSLNGSGTVTNTIATPVTLTVTNGSNGAFNGNLSNGAATTSLTVNLFNGSSAFNMSGATNTYTGATTLTSGTLLIGAKSLTANDPVVFNGGTLGFTTQPANDPSTNFAVAGNNSYAFNVPGGSTVVTLGGNLVDGPNGSTGVTMAGNGTLILSGTNTYTGATTITSGTLAFATPQSLPPSLQSGVYVPTSTGAFGIGEQYIELFVRRPGFWPRRADQGWDRYGHVHRCQHLLRDDQHFPGNIRRCQRQCDQPRQQQPHHRTQWQRIGDSGFKRLQPELARPQRRQRWWHHHQLQSDGGNDDAERLIDRRRFFLLRIDHRKPFGRDRLPGIDVQRRTVSILRCQRRFPGKRADVYRFNEPCQRAALDLGEPAHHQPIHLFQRRRPAGRLLNTDRPFPRFCPDTGPAISVLLAVSTTMQSSPLRSTARADR